MLGVVLEMRCGETERGMGGLREGRGMGTDTRPCGAGGYHGDGEQQKVMGGTSMHISLSKFTSFPSDSLTSAKASQEMKKKLF